MLTELYFGDAMTTSELIAKLQDILQVCGDIPVYYDAPCDALTPVVDAHWEQVNTDKQPIVVIE